MRIAVAIAVLLLVGIAVAMLRATRPVSSGQIPVTLTDHERSRCPPCAIGGLPSRDFFERILRRASGGSVDEAVLLHAVSYLDAAARACELEMASLRLGAGAKIDEYRLRDSREWTRIGPRSRDLANAANMTDEAVIAWSMSYAQPWAWFDERALVFRPTDFDTMLARVDGFFKEVSARNDRSQFKQSPYRTPFTIRSEWDTLRDGASFTRLTFRFGVRDEGAAETGFLAHVYFFQLGDRVGVHTVWIESFDLSSSMWFVL